MPEPTRDGKRLGLKGFFPPRGYAVVMVDLRGTGRSQGCLDHLGPTDAKDLKFVVEWAAAQPWSNGRVGMTGFSYVGSTPIVAAAQRPKGLTTIVPVAGLASMYDHQFQGGVPYYLQYTGAADRRTRCSPSCGTCPRRSTAARSLARQATTSATSRLRRAVERQVPHCWRGPDR
jgi:putative CocE/NonD family hydrolase